jgi:hypothetical protein
VTQFTLKKAARTGPFFDASAKDILCPSRFFSTIAGAVSPAESTVSGVLRTKRRTRPRKFRFRKSVAEMLTELLIVLRQDRVGRSRDQIDFRREGRFSKGTPPPFFPYRPVSAASYAPLDSPRHEHLPSTYQFSIFTRNPSPSSCAGDWKTPPAHRGGRNRRQLRFFGLFFNVFGF